MVADLPSFNEVELSTESVTKKPNVYFLPIGDR